MCISTNTCVYIHIQIHIHIHIPIHIHIHIHTHIHIYTYTETFHPHCGVARLLRQLLASAGVPHALLGRVPGESPAQYPCIAHSHTSLQKVPLSIAGPREACESPTEYPEVPHRDFRGGVPLHTSLSENGRMAHEGALDSRVGMIEVNNCRARDLPVPRPALRQGNPNRRSRVCRCC